MAEETTASGGGIALVGGMVVMAALGAVVSTLSSSTREGSSEQPAAFTRQAPQTLVKLLEDPTERTRAGFKLREHGRDAIPVLLRAVQDPAFKARPRAIRILGHLRATEAVPLLVALNEPALAQDRIVALGRIQGPQALAEIRKVLQDDQAPVPLLIDAVRAVSNWTEPPAELDPDVEPFLSHEVWALREFAALYFGRHKRTGAVPALIELLRDSNPIVRRKAAWSLMQIKAPAGIAAVDEALAAGAIPPDDD